MSYGGEEIPSYQNLTGAGPFQVTTVPALVVEIDISASADVAEYELRDGDGVSSSVVTRFRVAPNTSWDFHPRFQVSKLRIVKITGTAPEATIYYV